MKTLKNSLESIYDKYLDCQYNSDNYYIGGGLTDNDDQRTIDGECCYCGSNDGHYIGCARPTGRQGGKFASRRHEDANNDAGKLTLGEATKIFKKATGLTTDTVKAVLLYAIPNMEWHHAGKLPKRYGGGMKKTYFINADEICKCAKNWHDFFEKFNLSKIAAINAAEEKRNFEKRKLEFLQANAKRFIRISDLPHHYYLTGQEMQGKYGWFDSAYKSYNLPEYYSGWEFNSEEKYQEFLNLK